MATVREPACPIRWSAANIDQDDIVVRYSSKAQQEIREYVEVLMRDHTVQKISDVESLPIDRTVLTHVMEETESARKLAESKWGFCVFDTIDGISSPRELSVVPWIQSNIIGELLKQDENGTKVYAIFDERRGSMSDGIRYSRSPDQGSFHTDNVNDKKVLDYFLLSCIRPARTGGESVILDGLSVYERLAASHPEVLPALMQPRSWAYKGLRPGEYYSEPILKFTEDGQIVWRYLRDYLEEAYKQKGEEVPHDLEVAMDRIDLTHQISELQFRYPLQSGQSVLFFDRRMFHGRLAFEDDLAAMRLDDYLADPQPSRPIRRTYLRFWIQSRSRKA